jgi:hypothetical protein
MGMSYMLNVIALPDGHVPDWAAAEARIDQLSFEDLDCYFDYWDPDGDAKEEAAQDPAFAPKVRAELLEGLNDLRHAVDGNFRRDLNRFQFAGHTLFATGGASVGEAPSALYDSLSSLHAVGALELAGIVPVHVEERGLIDVSGLEAT